MEAVSNTEFLAQIWNNIFDNRIIAQYDVLLPLPSGQGSELYADPVATTTQYAQDVLEITRTEIATTVENEILQPLENS